MAGEEVLSIRNVTKQFGGVTAVSNVDMGVTAGEIISVIGPNGAGKTTLLNMVSGFYHPNEGSINVRNQDITNLGPSRIATLGIARTFQNIALFQGMTVLDNLMLGRHVHMRRGVFASMIRFGPAMWEEVRHREAVEDIIEFLEIQPLRKRPVGALAYGLQKRVELGRALAAEPHLLLLDEPMGGMNIEEKEDMVRFILDVNDQLGITIVLIEHDMSVVMDISDRVIVLEYGSKISEGTPEMIRNDQKVIDAYLGVSH